MPMWQAEAMWMLFKNDGPDWEREDTLSGHVRGELGIPCHWEQLRSGSGLPVAVKIAAGKVNAVSGEAWRPGLNQDPQDYVVSPLQPWLDGFAIKKGTVRQFVAMPLGEGYSVEEQVAGNSEWGGIQISVTPLKAAVWNKIKERAGEIQGLRVDALQSCREVTAMGAGGRMHQEVYQDIFALDDWDWAATERVFASLVHAKDWKAITGDAAPNEPPSARDYAAAGLPWFDHYGEGVLPLPGSSVLDKVKSVAQVFEHKTGAQLPSSQDVDLGKPTVLGPGAKGRARRAILNFLVN
jgi:hypothetical protein